jgi:hypothetical protein
MSAGWLWNATKRQQPDERCWKSRCPARVIGEQVHHPWKKKRWTDQATCCLRWRGGDGARYTGVYEVNDNIGQWVRECRHCDFGWIISTVPIQRVARIQACLRKKNLAKASRNHPWHGWGLLQSHSLHKVVTDQERPVFGNTLGHSDPCVKVRARGNGYHL